MIGFSGAHGLQPTRRNGKVVRFSDLYGWSFPFYGDTPLHVCFESCEERSALGTMGPIFPII